MADKSRLGPELPEAKVDASVEELLILEFLKNNYYSRACWIKNDYNQLGATRLVGYLSLHIQSALVE